VELLVKANLAGNIFEMIDALGNKNKKAALKLLHRHLKNGEDPFYIFSMFVYQFRNLLKVADYKENGGLAEKEIANASKLHPFVVKKSLNQINNFSLDRLKKVYQKLGNLDLKIKTGKIDIKLALDKFIVEL
jgi:DNA polymerase III subunit delta